MLAGAAGIRYRYQGGLFGRRYRKTGGISRKTSLEKTSEPQSGLCYKRRTGGIPYFQYERGDSMFREAYPKKKIGTSEGLP
jgi:hypothetical protein